MNARVSGNRMEQRLDFYMGPNSLEKQHDRTRRGRTIIDYDGGFWMG